MGSGNRTRRLYSHARRGFLQPGGTYGLPVEPEELAESIKRLVGWAEQHAPKPEPPVRVRLREHFGCEPGELPVVSRPLEAWDRPNLHVALEAWLAGGEVEVVGVSVMEGYRAGSPSSCAAGRGRARRARRRRARDRAAGRRREPDLRAGRAVARARRRATRRPDAEVDRSRHGRAARARGDGAAARDRGGRARRPAPPHARAQRLPRARARARRAPLPRRAGRAATIRSLPDIARESIVLPDGVLETVERQAFGVARHAERLRAERPAPARRGASSLHGPASR